MGVLKYIALYFGFMRISNYIIMWFYMPTQDTYVAMNDTSGVIAVLLTLLCYRAERSEMVVNAPNKKSKTKRFLLVLITLGIAVFVYKRRMKASWNG